MPSPSEEFLADLGRRRHEPLLRTAAGTIRIDLDQPRRADRWFVTIERGELTVSRRSRAADCRLRADADLFDKIAAGEANALAALLRGAVVAEGDLELLMLFQRLFPGPPAAATAGRRRAS
jgi:putative sterol carrier protein